MHETGLLYGIRHEKNPESVYEPSLIRTTSWLVNIA